MRRIAVIVVGTALVFAACGGSSNDEATPAATQAATETPTEAATETPTPTATASGSESGGTSTLKFEADPSGALAFTQKDLTAKAGKVKIEFANPSSVPHAVEIEGVPGSATETVTSADSPAVTVDLKPGEYTFFCPVDGHRAAGMEGKLTVR